MTADLMTKLGASVIILPGGEVYSALERGVIDATDGGTPSMNHRLGFHEVTKYFNYPGFHSMPDGDFTVNMGQGIKYDIGTTRERSCDAAECSFDTWSNNIAGSGGLIKKGSGTLQLSGNNTYAGNTFINEGGIDITGSLSSGIIVNKLGTLSGQGQSATIEINSGRFAP